MRMLAGLMMVVLAVGMANAALMPFTYSEDFEGVPVGTDLPAGYSEDSGEWQVASIGGTQRALDQGVALPQLASFGDDQWLNFEASMIVRSENYVGNGASSLYFGYRTRIQDDGSALAVRWYRKSTADPGASLQICRIHPGGINPIQSSSWTSTMDSFENWRLIFNAKNNDDLGQLELFAQMVYVGGGDGGVDKSVSINIPYTDNLFSTQPSLLLPGKHALWGYDNTTHARDFSYDDIYITGEMVPEPATMMLLAAGSLLLRKRK